MSKVTNTGFCSTAHSDSGVLRLSMTVSYLFLNCQWTKNAKPVNWVIAPHFTRSSQFNLSYLSTNAPHFPPSSSFYSFLPFPLIHFPFSDTSLSNSNLGLLTLEACCGLLALRRSLILREDI